MAKAYSYIRFSSPEQSKGNSLDRQIALAADYAVKNNLDLDDSLTFQDLGVSAFTGMNSETGALAAFKRAVESGLVVSGSYLLVESLDRISRQTARKAVRILEDICDLDITVVTLNDGKAYTGESLSADPISFLMSFLVFMRSNEESATKSKRLSAAWITKRSKVEKENKPLSRVVVGWTKANDDRTAIELIPERAEIVRGIFKDFLAGVGAESIARELNKAGVDTWGAGKKKALKWNKSYIAKILKNPAVTGQLTMYTLVRTATKKQRIPQQTIDNYYPRVIDNMTFERVQELLEGKGTRGRKCSQEVKNILSFLGKCPLCGATMTRTNKGANQYLVCVAAKGKAGCVIHNIPYGAIETAILKTVPLLLPAIQTDSKERSAVRLKIAKLERGMKQRQIVINRLISLVKSGTVNENTIMNEDDFAPTFVSVRHNISDLEISNSIDSSEIEQLENEYQKSNPRIIDEKIQALMTAIKTGASLAEINACMRAVFLSAVIDYNNKRVMLRFRHRNASLPVSWRSEA